MDDYDYDELKNTKAYQDAIKGHKDRFTLIEERLKLLEKHVDIDSANIKCVCGYCNGRYNIEHAKAEIEEKRRKTPNKK